MKRIITGSLKESAIYLAVIVWIALIVYFFATGQVNKGISFDMNGNCHGDGCAEWYEKGG